MKDDFNILANVRQPQKKIMQHKIKTMVLAINEWLFTIVYSFDYFNNPYYQTLDSPN